MGEVKGGNGPAGRLLQESRVFAMTNLGLFRINY
jgi:hypothetical protein